MDIQLRPELRTDGGEMISIFDGEDWVGDAYLLYREGDMLTGTIQVDSTSVPAEKIPEVMEVAGSYVRDLVDALGVSDATLVSLQGDIRTVLDVVTAYPTVEQESEVKWNVEPVVSADDPQDYQFTLELNPDGTMIVERFQHH